MSTSKKLFTRSKKIIPTGVNSPVRLVDPYPFFVRKANGAYIYDVDGKKLIDFCNSYGAIFLGHCNNQVIHGVREQLKKGTMYGAPTESEIVLAELISNNFPSMQRVRLVSTGSEATMTAIRLARGFTKRNKIIKFEGCYHGTHDSVLVKAGSGSAHHSIPTSEGSLPSVSHNTIVIKYNDPLSIKKGIQRHKDELAAVIVEPVLANMGLILPRRNFLQEIRKITRQHGILLIFDEVVTGFRLSPGGAQQYYSVKPDITCLSKALGNGFPVAAVGGHKDIMDSLVPHGKVYQASTYAGNPISTVAAINTVKAINKNKQKLYPKLRNLCDDLTKSIHDFANDLKIPHTLNKIESMFQIFFTDSEVIDYKTAKLSDSRRFNLLVGHLFKKGVFVPPSQFETCFLSYSHTDKDIDTTKDAYQKSLKKVRSLK